MSLILDALNRADKERSEQQQIPNLHASPVSATRDTSPAARWLLEGVLLAAVIGVAVYFFSAHDPITPADTTEPPVAQAREVPPATTAASPGPVGEPATAQPEARIANTTTQPVAPAASTAIAQLYRQQQAQPEPKMAAGPPSATSQPTRSPPARPKPTGRDILRQIPLLATLSPRFREAIPNIEYSMHVYNEEDGSGIVNLNGTMRKIGAEVAPGLRVIAILPDSVVLDYRGTQFRLLALNSWMNFK